MSDINVRNMTREELDIAVEWAAREGWNPGLHDAECFYAVDPTGFFIAETDGEPVGFISAVAYGSEFGFIGFYIVKPECRGHRIGIELGKAGLTYLGARNVGLDGVENKVSNYETHGFKLAYHNHRYEGVVRHVQQDVPQLRSVDAVSLDDIAAYDRRCFPADRRQFLKDWFHLADSTALAYVDNGVLRGLGMIRACRNGYKVAPLYADNKDIAAALFQGLLNSADQGKAVFLDVPELNEEARKLAEERSMKVVFGTARMYSRDEPDIEMQRIFGITSFELG